MTNQYPCSFALITLLYHQSWYQETNYHAYYVAADQDRSCTDSLRLQIYYIFWEKPKGRHFDQRIQ
jgi:hypothetical protein